jgi:hypothetical protein
MALLACGPAHAARPLITDDARITEAKSCQLETWVRRNEGSSERWALPACNPTGNLELTLGGAMTAEFGQTHLTDTQVQAKTLFRKLETNGWGIGLAVGHLHHPREPQSRGVVSDLYGYVPASFSYANDKVVVHANVGALRSEDESRHRITWGTGAELQLQSGRVYLVPEIFSQGAGKPQYQAGLRFWVVPNRVQVDATYGDRFGAAQGGRWFSLGLRLLAPPFLP